MNDAYIFTTLEIIFSIFCILVVIQLFKKFKQTRNTIYLGLVLFQITLIIYSIVQIHIYHYGNIHTFGAGLTISTLTFLTLLTLQALFFFYLKGLKKFYTLPFIAGFFVAAALVLNQDNSPIVYYSIVSGYMIAILLVIEGFKNKNGIPLSLGLTVIIIGIGSVIDQFFVNEIARLIFWIVGMSIFLLGARGFFEKYILMDKLEEENIKNTWISRLVIEKKKG